MFRIHRILGFWASQVRIRQRYGYGSGSSHHQAKIVRKLLISSIFWFLCEFLSVKNDVKVPSKSTVISQKTKKFSCLLVSWRSLTKRAGSGAGFEDPDLYQNLTDPENCFKLFPEGGTITRYLTRIFSLFNCGPKICKSFLFWNVLLFFWLSPHAAPQIPMFRRMLVLNQGLLQLPY